MASLPPIRVTLVRGYRLNRVCVKFIPVDTSALRITQFASTDAHRTRRVESSAQRPEPPAHEGLIMTTAGQDLTPVGSTPRPDTLFTVKMRGYCRDQVDAHLRSLAEALAEAEESCRLARLRADTAEADRAGALAELHERGGRIPEPRGAMTAPAIGLAAERARWAAECEAQQARLTAARATTLRLERARECAEPLPVPAVHQHIPSRDTARRARPPAAS